MPRVRQTTSQKAEDAVRGALGRIQGQYRLSDDQMAASIGVTPRTYRNKMKRPATFTFAELRRYDSIYGLLENEKLGMFPGR